MRLSMPPVIPDNPMLTSYLLSIYNLTNGQLGTDNFMSSINNGLTNTGEYSLIITAPGTMYADYQFYDGFYPKVKISITEATIFASTMPTGSNLTLDFLKNSIEQSKTLTLLTTASNHLQKTTFASALTYLPTDRMGLIVKTVGSTEAGRNLNVSVNIKVI